ncbi:M48 family metallopeptidase [Sphingorhabdus rigui]|nr:SprT family zinc-dependent metalloprotease [Sphingorhabdus rigui]
MVAELQLGDLSIDLVFKDIKNIHLSVYPPTGRVRIAAPTRANIETIRAFAISKLVWIRKHQTKLAEQERQPPREFLDRESHYLWGRRMLLQIVVSQGRPSIDIEHKKITLRGPEAFTLEAKQRLLDKLYRREARRAIEPIASKWEKILGIEINQIYWQRMKTRWGSCNPQSGNIRLNLELAKKPLECLEYILLHEALHFLVPNHGEHFLVLLDQHMSNWRTIRQILADEPLAHSHWKY